MAAYDTSALDRSIASFEETIQALKEIQNINRELGVVAGKIGEQDERLKADSEKLQRAYSQINFALDDLKGSARAYTADIKNIFKEQKKDLTDLQSDLMASQEKAVSSYIDRTEQMEHNLAGKLDENVQAGADNTESVTAGVK